MRALRRFKDLSLTYHSPAGEARIILACSTTQGVKNPFDRNAPVVLRSICISGERSWCWNANPIVITSISHRFHGGQAARGQSIEEVARGRIHSRSTSTLVTAVAESRSQPRLATDKLHNLLPVLVIVRIVQSGRKWHSLVLAGI